MDVSFQKNSLLVPGDNIIGITIPGKGIIIYHAKDEELHKYENNPMTNAQLTNKKGLKSQLAKIRRLAQPFFLPLDQSNGWEFIWLLVCLLFWFHLFLRI